MLPEQNLLVAAAGDVLTAGLLRRARGLLGLRGSVTLLHVVPCHEEEASDLRFRVDPRHRPALRRLAELRAGIADSGALIRAKLRFGDPSTEILREIVEFRQDLVVMGTRSRAELPAGLLGSVTREVLRASPVPLVLFRPETAPDAVPFEQLLVALDGSEDAEEILPCIHALARILKSKVHLFRAVPPGPQEARELRAADVVLRALQKLLELEEISSESHVRHGAPAPEALALIRERRLDAVALTTHGHSGFLRSLFGSVAWEILRDGRVPAFVLTNRAYRQPLPAPAWNPRHLLIEG